MANINLEHLQTTLQILYTGCPLCNSEITSVGAANCKQHAMWHEPLPSTLEWMRCSQCGHVHTRHYWSEAGLAEVFRNAHTTQLAGMTDNPDAKRATWVPVVERVIGLLGGGTIRFLAALRHRSGWMWAAAMAH